MDINYLTNVFVAKNCARTNGADTIDGVAVTGVQTTVSTDDAGAAATTYYGPGELVITEESGLVLDPVTANDKTINGIKIAQRSYDGLHTYGSKSLLGKNITSLMVDKYKAPSEGVIAIDNIDATLLDYSYNLKIRKTSTDLQNHDEKPVVKSFSFRSGLTGSTATEILTGLMNKINLMLNSYKDDEISVEAFLNSTNDGLIIRALPKPFEIGKFNYGKYLFTVQLNFDADEYTNMTGQDLTYDTILYPAATEGTGTWEQVLEMEYAAKGYTGANRDKMSESRARTDVAYDTKKYEDDGVTINRYDIINLNWEADLGQLGRAWQQGTIAIALPVDDNTINQQTDILDTLVSYIITAYGLGVPTPTLT